MTYTHLTTDELVIIESYFKMNQSVAKTAHCLNRSRQTIHKVYLFFKQGKSALEYYINSIRKTNQTVVDVRLFYPRNNQNIFKERLFKMMDTRCDCWSCSVSY
uniref:IS30 family transposase n=1 Tax=Enterococcus faecium TaxID=1352 RepID=A0A455TVK7_ENTFC|nr:IS30 family transposase [Enterococcus faecium]